MSHRRIDAIPLNIIMSSNSSKHISIHNDVKYVQVKNSEEIKHAAVHI